KASNTEAASAKRDVSIKEAAMSPIMPLPAKSETSDTAATEPSTDEAAEAMNAEPAKPDAGDTGQPQSPAVEGIKTAAAMTGHPASADPTPANSARDISKTASADTRPPSTDATYAAPSESEADVA